MSSLDMGSCGKDRAARQAGLKCWINELVFFIKPVFLRRIVLDRIKSTLNRSLTIGLVVSMITTHFINIFSGCSSTASYTTVIKHDSSQKLVALAPIVTAY
jgi:hypothetical protein